MPTKCFLPSQCYNHQAATTKTATTAAVDLRIYSCFTQQQYTQVLPIVTFMT